MFNAKYSVLPLRLRAMILFARGGKSIQKTPLTAASPDSGD